MIGKKTSLLPVVLLAGTILAACSTGTPQTPTIDSNEILTQAAGTVAVELTRNAALTPSPVPPTPTQPATETPAPTATVEATAAPVLPAQPTNTQAVSAPAGQTAPDSATFVEDVTVPDGTGADPSAKFEKVWRIKNTGTTTWTQAYALVYIDGERMGAPDSIPMPKEVRPNETVDISVTLTAPAKAGTYQTFFRLRNASGQYYRLDGSGDLWIKINVGGGATATVAPTGTATAGATP